MQAVKYGYISQEHKIMVKAVLITVGIIVSIVIIIGLIQKPRLYKRLCNNKKQMKERMLKKVLLVLIRK